jgi:cytosine/adenosine deaminase-related metal-dependent hydrolase
LNEFAHARSRDCRPRTHARASELHALERIDALVRRNGARLALAIRCAPIASAFDLVYARNVASEARLALGFELSESAPSAQAFRERFYTSEIQLLDFLQLLHPGSIVWAGPQLSARDIDLLIRSGVNVAVRGAGSMTTRRRPAPFNAALESAPPPARICALLDIQATGGNANACVDAATVRAAGALGESRCGRIAPDMYADLCLFQVPRRPPLGAGSEAFIGLFESGQPAAVVMAGAFVHPSAFSPQLRSTDHPMRADHAASVAMLLAAQA